MPNTGSEGLAFDTRFCVDGHRSARRISCIASRCACRSSLRAGRVLHFRRGQRNGVDQRAEHVQDLGGLGGRGTQLGRELGGRLDALGRQG